MKNLVCARKTQDNFWIMLESEHLGNYYTSGITGLYIRAIICAIILSKINMDVIFCYWSESSIEMHKSLTK